MEPIVTLADTLTELGLTAPSADATKAGRILDAVSSEIRRLCRREFEGAEATYTAEMYRLRGVREFNLLHTPVKSITSIARTYLDGSVDEAYLSTEYRIEDSTAGHVRLGTSYGPRDWPEDWSYGGPECVRVTYKTTGAVPAEITLACLEWVHNRWTTWGERADLAGYKTGDDEESYFASLAGRPSHNVARALGLNYHASGGGVV